MADPLACLRISSILTGFWNIVKDLQWEYENRQIPMNGAIDGFQARFPGLYALYSETPERRRVNAMYAIVLVNVFLALVHLLFSIPMTWGAYKRKRAFILPWFFTGGAIIIMSTAYAVLWWSGDIFNEQLVMAVAEFIVSLALNGILFVVVIFYYIRLSGGLTSNKPAGGHKRRHHKYTIAYVPDEYREKKEERRGRRDKSRKHKSRSRSRSGERRHRGEKTQHKRHEPNHEVPPWRTEWEDVPPDRLRRKMNRKQSRERKEMESQRQRGIQDNGIDLCAPETDDPRFPWKLPPPQREPRIQPHGTGSIIRELYYEDFPSERSFKREPRPRGRRGRSLDELHREEVLLASPLRPLQSNMQRAVMSPVMSVPPTVPADRVTFSRQDPEVRYRTPEETPSSQAVRGEPHSTQTVV